MTRKTLYSDKLVSVTDEDITFFNYYFPNGGEKRVKRDDIESITVLEPTIRNGKLRVHGTGDFKVWFPKDKSRAKRDRIFMAKLKSQWVDIGFTVEDGDIFESLMREKNLLA